MVPKNEVIEEQPLVDSPTSVLEEELKPGLSAFAKDPKAAADSLLPLLEKAEKVVPQDMRQNTPVKVGEGNEVFFRIKRSTRFKKLINAYCDRQSVEMNSIVFLFDGRCLRVDQTPDEVEVQNASSVIEVFDAISYEKGSSLIRIDAWFCDLTTGFTSRGISRGLQSPPGSVPDRCSIV